MAATRGTGLLRLLHESAAAQAARYQPAGAQFSAPAFGSSPSQSILRRLFADGTQTIDRASIEAADEAQKGKEFAQEKTEQVKEEGETVAEKVKDKAGKELDTAGDMAKDVPTKTKETAQDIKEVGIEAAKAVKRDASKLAEKVGLKTPSE